MNSDSNIAKFVEHTSNIPINTCDFITQLNSLEPLLTIRLSDRRVARTSCMSYNVDKVKKRRKKKKEENTRPTLVQFVIVPFSFCSIIWFIYTCNLSRDGYTGIAYRLLMRINKEDFLTNSLQRMVILDGIENENSSLNFLEISRIWRIFQQNFTSRNWLDRIESRAEFRLYTFNAEFTILERNDIPRNRQIPYHVVRSLVSCARHCIRDSEISFVIWNMRRRTNNWWKKIDRRIERSTKQFGNNGSRRGGN